VKPGAGLRPWERLRRQAEFRTVFRKGRRLNGPLFTLLVHRNALAWSRLGLAVGRRFGGAVARNRARRVLREGFRNVRHDLVGMDVVVLPKPALTRCGRAEVERELERQLAGVRRPGRRGAGPVAGD